MKKENKQIKYDEKKCQKKKEEKKKVKKEEIPNMAKSLCPVFKKCGGCDWLDIPYEDQLKRKDKYLQELLKEFGKVEPIIGMDNPKYYRNKVVSSFGEDKNHRIITGIYEKNSHFIVPMDYCMIENQKADEIIITIRKLMTSFKYRAYRENSEFGLVRHVLIRTGYATGEIMVVLVLSTPILPSKNNFIKALRKVHPEITTIVLNVNYKATSMILGDKESILYGKGYIEDELCGKRFRISAKSFYQVNPQQTHILYTKAMEMAQLAPKDVVVDAYCGTGTIGIILADKVEKVIGVELNKEAVRDARMNAKNNQIKNIEFYEKDAGEFLVQMAEQDAKVDIVFMDPPRSGSSEVFLKAIAKLSPKKVVYISCGPESLARDLRILKKTGYKVKKMASVDMFPWTKGIESVCLLTKSI